MVDMSASEPTSMHPAGPTIEWLEPKLPDLLKNGGSPPSLSLSLAKDDAGKPDGAVLEPLEMDSCDAVGVRQAHSN